MATIDQHSNKKIQPPYRKSAKEYSQSTTILLAKILIIVWVSDDRLLLTEDGTQKFGDCSSEVTPSAITMMMRR